MFINYNYSFCSPFENSFLYLCSVIVKQCPETPNNITSIPVFIHSYKDFCCTKLQISLNLRLGGFLNYLEIGIRSEFKYGFFRSCSIPIEYSNSVQIRSDVCV